MEIARVREPLSLIIDLAGPRERSLLLFLQGNSMNPVDSAILIFLVLLFYVEAIDSPLDMPRDFWPLVALFLLICESMIWPPPNFLNWGVLLENIPRPNWHDGSLLGYIETQIAFNRLYFSAVTLAFSFFFLFVFGPYSPDGLLHILIYSFLIAIVAFLCISIIFSTLVRTVKRFSLEEMEFINGEQASSDTIERATTDWLGAQLYFLNSRFIICGGRFSYSIYRMADLKFTVIDSFTYDNDGTEGLEMQAEEITENSKSFIFPIAPDALRGRHSFGDVKVHENLYNQFIEKLVNTISGNPKKTMSGISGLDACFACHTKQPDVIIRSNCDSNSCDRCACRPAWCVACLARVFVAAQPEIRPMRWIEGTARCPFCRGKFCAKDVLFIREKVSFRVILMSLIFGC